MERAMRQFWLCGTALAVAAAAWPACTNGDGYVDCSVTGTREACTLECFREAGTPWTVQCFGDGGGWSCTCVAGPNAGATFRTSKGCELRPNITYTDWYEELRAKCG
jgi:hypothetical protein